MMVALTDVALAQFASRTIHISAVVPKFCTVAGRPTPIDVAVSITVDPHGVVSASWQPITARIVCNASATLKVISLRGSARASDGTELHYRTVVSFANASARLDTHDSSTSVPTSANTSTTTTAATGAIVVALTPHMPLGGTSNGGTYTDTLRIVLSPR